MSAQVAVDGLRAIPFRLGHERQDGGTQRAALGGTIDYWRGRCETGGRANLVRELL